MICYRRYGHNEADEPAFTQPRMYELIEAHPSPRTRYTEALVREGDMTADEARGVGDDFRARLDAAFSETHQSAPPDASQAATPDAPSEPRLPAPQPDPSVRVATNVERWTLERVIDGLMSRPEGFTVHAKLERILQAHRVAFEKGLGDPYVEPHKLPFAAPPRGEPRRLPPCPPLPGSRTAPPGQSEQPSDF